jgi:hypothetical protein
LELEAFTGPKSWTRSEMDVVLSHPQLTGAEEVRGRGSKEQ